MNIVQEGKKENGETMLTKRGVTDSAVSAWSGVTQSSFVIKQKIVSFAVNLGIIL